MSVLVRRKPSPSMIVALVALFIALGGSAWAIKANSIGSKQIRNGQVKMRDIGPRAVTSAKLFMSKTVSHDIEDLPPNTCVGALLHGFEAVRATDSVIVTAPSSKPLQITIAVGAEDGKVVIDTCNPSSLSIDPPPGDYEFTIIR